MSAPDSPGIRRSRTIASGLGLAVMLAVVACGRSTEDAALAAGAGHGIGLPESADSDRSGLHSGHEVLVYLVAASFCHGVHAPGFKQAMRSMRTILSKRKMDRGDTYYLIGVSLDWSPAEGLKFLKPLGDFDEIIVGRNWLNDAAVHLIWRDLPAPATIPQIVVVERDTDSGNAGLSVGADVVRLRKMGAEEMIAWVNSGMPF